MESEPLDPGHSCSDATTDSGGELLHPLAESTQAQSDMRHMRLSTAVLRQKLKRMALKQLNATEASKLVGCSPATAQKQYADPEFRRECHDALEQVFGAVDEAYAEKQRSMHELLEDQAYKSFKDLMDMLEQEDLQPNLRVKINQDFLDRSAESAAFSPKAAPTADAKTLAVAAKAAREMDNVIEIRQKAS